VEHHRGFEDAPAREPGVVAASAYVAGRRVADVPIAEAGAWSRKPGHIVWIGLHEPEHGLLLRIQEQFGLHDLALSDATTPHGYPKVEQYGDALFVVARTAQLVGKRLAFGETQVFLGKGFIVSVRHGASTSYAAVREHWEACPAVLAAGEDFILFALLDFIVDNYKPVLEAIAEEVEAIEDSVLASQLNRAEIERLYMLRRDLLRLRNAGGPLIEVCRRLSSLDLPQISPAMRPHFRDITDHVHAVDERIDALREVLAFAFEASLLMGQEQANQVAKKLAAWAAILAVPTAIAGVYGMNFENMPELRMSQAYHLVLGGMLAVCGVLYWRFKKTGWL
jgi:magnesium transporter